MCKDLITELYRLVVVDARFSGGQNNRNLLHERVADIVQKRTSVNSKCMRERSEFLQGSTARYQPITRKKEKATSFALVIARSRVFPLPSREYRLRNIKLPLKRRSSASRAFAANSRVRRGCPLLSYDTRFATQPRTRSNGRTCFAKVSRELSSLSLIGCVSNCTEKIADDLIVRERCECVRFDASRACLEIGLRVTEDG